MAGMAGLEPTISESKSGVLPLHYIPMINRKALSRKKWGGIWGSNPRHPEPQSGALPTELIPPYINAEVFSNARRNSKRNPPGIPNGTPKGIRTPDLLLRRQLLYPAELLAQMDGAGDGNRTRIPSLEGWCPGHCAIPAHSPRRNRQLSDNST